MHGVLQRLLVRLYDWLACVDLASDGDLIFALAGRESRKTYALEMLARGRAPQLLLSVGRFEIRRFSNLPLNPTLNLSERAASVSPQRRHFFVSLTKAIVEVELIPKRRLGTLSEIRALKTFLLGRSEINTVLIVSSAPHLRRVRLCCRILLPPSVKFRLLPVNEEADRFRCDLWWQPSKTRAIVLLEFPKMLLYWTVLHFESATQNAVSSFRDWCESF